MKTKRWIAALLCFLLIGSLFPTSAFAADIASGTGWKLSDDGVLYITGDIPESGFNLTDEQKGQVKSVVAESGASISSGEALFEEFENMTSADLRLLNTTGVRDMSSMFMSCNSLTSLDVSGFDTSSVTDMSYMFYGCSSLTSLNLSNFNTISVTTMGHMFENCSNLTSLDVSSFETDRLMYAKEMFRGCSALTSLGISPDILYENADCIIAIRSPWQKQGSTDTYSTADELKAVTDIVTLLAMYIASGTGWKLDADGVLHITGAISESGFNLTADQKSQVKSVVAESGASISSGYSLFYEFRSMVSADLRELDTSSVTSMIYMFYDCSSLTSLDLSSFDTSIVNDMSSMFARCSSLTSLDVSGFKTDSLMSADDMFLDCSSLTSLGIRPDILYKNADGIIAIRSPWQKRGSTDTYSTADELKAVTDTVTLLAMYTVNVQNDGNGTASANPAAAVKDETVTLTATPNTGYHFKEWQSSDVTVSGNNTFTMPEKNVTVKAIFEADAPTTYTVTFDVNGGSVTPTSAVTGTDGKLVSLPTPTRSGSYRFNGWYTAANGGTKVTVDDVYPADTTIYAHWTYTGGGVTYYTLTFNVNGGSAISSVSGTYGKVIDLDKYVPTKSGFDFGGWYSDSALTNPVDEIKLNGNNTVYAKWNEENLNTGAELPFTDVKEADWSYDDIYYVGEKGLMQGTSETTFAPKTNTSRDMIVTILYRLAGEPAVSGTCPFTDVKSGSYYEKAITWAAANKIVSGYGDGKFGADDPITREQMATILYHFAEFMGYDVSAKANLSGYTDAGNISAYAKDALAWANAKGLVTGTSATTLSPKGSATREQVAAILHRFCENIVK